MKNEGPQTPNEVRELVFEYLERAAEEGQGVLEELCEREPSLAAALRDRVLLLPAPLSRDTPAATTEPPARLGPFEVKETLGGGGMGIVYRARDERLGRDVAVKIIRPGELHFPGARERFRREVEAVARLSHEGIVPVYSAGEENDVPYLAMECVDGCTLAEALRVLKGRDVEGLRGIDFATSVEEASGAAPGSTDGIDLFSGSWADCCARIIARIADALGHAHERGVLHRDVKTSNVMITASGRVMLVDFGLATTEGLDRITRTGSALGSLPYMSPEQLEGDWTHHDRRSDVYSLGVTLYELLTLDLPFRSSSIAQLRDAVLGGKAAPARSKNGRVSWELETIAAVAMDVDPAHRYASCEALRADLLAALEGRPIESRRASTARRVRMWARRSPAAAGLIAVSALVSIGGPILFGVQERRARLDAEAQGRIISDQKSDLDGTLVALRLALDDARAQRDLAVAQEGRAERNLDRAIRAIDGFLSSIGDEDLRDVPYFQGLRNRVLTEAVELFDELLEEERGDGRVRLQTARAARRVGDIRALLGRVDEAEAAFRDSIAILDSLLVDAPDDTAILLQKIETRRLLAVLLRSKSRIREADAEFGQALEEAAGSHGEGATTIRQRANAIRIAQATLWTDEGRTAEARATLELILPELQDAALGDPESVRAAMELARAYQTLGRIEQMVFPMTDDALERGCEHLRSAIEVLDLAHGAHADNTGLRRDLARSRMNLANALRGRREFASATELAEQAVAATAALMDEFGGVPTYMSDHATALAILGSIEFLRGRPEEGLRAMREAESTFEDLVELKPGEADPIARLAQVRLGLGHYLWNFSQDADQALDSLRTAIENYDHALELMPSTSVAAREREQCHQVIVMVLLSVEDTVAAANAALEWTDVAVGATWTRAAGLWTARCAIAAEGDESLPDDERAALVELLDSTAAELVERLLESGTLPSSLTSDPEYADLCSRPEVAAVLEV